jgi:hypothetical protein
MKLLFFLDENINSEIGELGVLLAYFQSRSDLVDRIKATQMKDEWVCKIWDELG